MQNHAHKEFTDRNPLPRPSHAFVYARRSRRVKVTAKVKIRGLHLHRVKCAISPPCPVDLFESSLEVASIHHVIDSRIDSDFPRSRRLGLLRWGCRHFLLFLHHVLLGRCHCCLGFALTVLLRPKLFSCLGLGLGWRGSRSGCGCRVGSRGSDWRRSRNTLNNRG